MGLRKLPRGSTILAVGNVDLPCGGKIGGGKLRENFVESYILLQCRRRVVGKRQYLRSRADRAVIRREFVNVMKVHGNCLGGEEEQGKNK